MPQIKKPGTPVRAGNIHFSNETDAPDNNKNDQGLLNNDKGDHLLIEPSEDQEGGDTHDGNDLRASTVRGRRRRFPVSADAVPLPDDESNNIGTLDNEETDPADGYLPDNGAGAQPEIDLAQGQTPANELLVANEGDFDDDDESAGLPDDDEDLDPEGDDDDDGGLDGEEDDDGEVDAGVKPKLTAAEDFDSSEELPLVDIKKLGDKYENCAFAVRASTLLLLKGNTVIATLSRTGAIKAGVQDNYLKEPYQEVAETVLQKHGIRAGLKQLGFRMETVALGASDVVNKRVQAAALQVRAKVERANANRDAIMEQSMAIASVGIARNYFKKSENPLRAALASELAAAGVKGADRMLSRVFAQNGPAMLKEVYALAQKLAAMPQEMRDGHAENLDMLNDEGTVEEACDTTDMGTGMPQMVTSEDEGDFDPSMLGEDEDVSMVSQATVQASLLHPAKRSRQQVIQASTEVTAAQRAQAIFDGTLGF